MTREQDQTGGADMTARLVEEGYVNLQDTMRVYRQAKHQGSEAAGVDAGTDPVILLQDAVQTFFELVRPYINNEPRLAEYWRGALAKYPDRQFRSVAQALEYYREHSVGVWQAQDHTQIVHREGAATNGTGTAVADGGVPDTLADWHNALNLPKTVRMLSVQQPDDVDFEGWVYKEGRFAVLGLREVADWEVRQTTERRSGEGFMAGETSTTQNREAEPAPKVETAARMLVEVADELNAIASYEPAGERVHGTPVPDE